MGIFKVDFFRIDTFKVGKMLEADIVEKKKYKERGKIRIYTQGSVLTEKYKDGYQGTVRDWKTKVKFKGEIGEWI